MLCNALSRYTSSGGIRRHLPLKGEGLLSGFVLPTEILSLRYRLSVFLSRRKKNSEKERPLRGLRREVSPDLLRRTEMKSKAGAQCGSAPRDPPENGQAGRDKQQRYCAQRRRFLYSGQGLFARRAARHDFAFAFPSEGCEAGAW